MPSPRSVRAAAALSLILTPVLAAAGQSSVTVSPFVSYVPSAASNPLAGFALTFGGTTGLALRSAVEMSISNPPALSDSAMGGGYRPWGADADAMLFLGGLGGGATVFSRALSPYVFAGIGLTGGDSAGSNVVRNGWSYGAGAAIPLGLHADIFGEARWRMTEYVLPTSNGAPDSKSSFRFGLSFHVGGSSAGPSRGVPGPRRRHRAESAQAQDDVEYVVTPAPAPAPVVVVTPAPAPEPQVVYVEPEPQVVYVEPQPVESERVVVTRGATVRRSTRSRVATQQTVVVEPTPVHTRPTARVYGRATSRPTARQSGTPGASARPNSTSSARVITKAPSNVQPSRGRIVTRSTAQSRAATKAPEVAPQTERSSATRAPTSTRASTRASRKPL